MSSIKSRVRASLVAVAAASTIAVTSAAPAEAWPGDAGVTQPGFASCHTIANASGVPAQDAWIYVHNTGEIHEVSVNQWTEYFAARFNNVPASGSWADVWIYCAVPGTQAGWRYARTIWLSRPLWGSTAWYVSVSA